MTTREFYLAVIDFTSTMEATDNDMTFGPSEAHPTELTAKAQELLAALDAKNEKRKATPTKEQREVAQRVLLVEGFFEKHTPDEHFTRDDIAAATGMKPGEATAACKVLIATGKVVKGEAKINKAHRVVYSVSEGAQYLDREIEA